MSYLLNFPWMKKGELGIWTWWNKGKWAIGGRLPCNMNFKGAGVFSFQGRKYYWFGCTKKQSTRNKGEHVPHPLNFGHIREEKKIYHLFGGCKAWSVHRSNQVLVRARRWRPHLKKNLRMLGIKLMSYQEFQRAHWKDLREKGGAEDCFQIRWCSNRCGDKSSSNRDDLRI